MKGSRNNSDMQNICKEPKLKTGNIRKRESKIITQIEEKNLKRYYV